jgi:hypothetical protein
VAGVGNVVRDEDPGVVEIDEIRRGGRIRGTSSRSSTPV